MNNFNFKRDSYSNALINQNIEELEAYKKRREMRNKLLEKEQKYDAIQTDINILKDELQEIKNLLQQILTRD